MNKLAEHILSKHQEHRPCNVPASSHFEDTVRQLTGGGLTVNNVLFRLLKCIGAFGTDFVPIEDIEINPGRSYFFKYLDRTRNTLYSPHNSWEEYYNFSIPLVQMLSTPENMSICVDPRYRNGELCLCFKDPRAPRFVRINPDLLELDRQTGGRLAAYNVPGDNVQDLTKHFLACF